MMWDFGGWQYRERTHTRRRVVFDWKAEFKGYTAIPFVYEHNYPSATVRVGRWLHVHWSHSCGC